MGNIFYSMKTLATQLGTSVEKTRHAIVQFFNKTTKPNPSIAEMAELVRFHPNCHKETKELLGITFTYYHLVIDSYQYVVECRGKQDEKLLEFNIRDKSYELFSYKSYDDSMKPTDKMKIDSETFFSLLK